MNPKCAKKIFDKLLRKKMTKILSKIWKNLWIQNFLGYKKLSLKTNKNRWLMRPNLWDMKEKKVFIIFSMRLKIFILHSKSSLKQNIFYFIFMHKKLLWITSYVFMNVSFAAGVERQNPAREQIFILTLMIDILFCDP